MKHFHALAREIEQAIQAEGRLARQILSTIWSVVRRFEFQLEDALEMVHEILSVLLMKARNQEFRGRAAFTTFVYQVSINLCLKRLRQLTCPKHGGDATHVSMSDAVTETLQADPRHSNPLEILKQKEAEQLVRQCLETLTHKESRETLTLLLKGLRRQEIGAALQMPLKRVDAALNYGKKKLTQALRKKTRMRGET